MDRSRIPHGSITVVRRAGQPDRFRARSRYLPAQIDESCTFDCRENAERWLWQRVPLIEDLRAGYLSIEQFHHRSNSGKPLAEMLEEFKRKLIASRISEKESSEVHSRLARLLEHLRTSMKVSSAGAFTGVAIQQAIDEIGKSKATTKEPRGLSHETLNRFLRDAKRFAKFVGKQTGYAADFDDIKKYNVAVDRRHLRRVLSVEELHHLMAVAEAGPIYQKRITGPERAMVYRLVMGTGLRANEVRTLRREDVIGDDGGLFPWSLRIEAVNSKHKRVDDQTITEALARALLTFAEKRPYGSPIFRFPAKAFLMLRFDLQAAGIVYETRDGHADFHALRHTFCTLLASNKETSIGALRKVMRHACLSTTQKYMHPNLFNEQRAVNSLPSFLTPPVGTVSPQPQKHRATGTDHARAGDAADAENPQLRILPAPRSKNPFMTPVRKASKAAKSPDNLLFPALPAIADPTEKSSCFGSRRPLVQIQSSRLHENTVNQGVSPSSEVGAVSPVPADARSDSGQDVLSLPTSPNPTELLPATPAVPPPASAGDFARLIQLLEAQQLQIQELMRRQPVVSAVEPPAPASPSPTDPEETP